MHIGSRWIGAAGPEQSLRRWLVALSLIYVVSVGGGAPRVARQEPRLTAPSRAPTPGAWTAPSAGSSRGSRSSMSGNGTIAGVFPDSACVPRAVGVPHVTGAAPLWWDANGNGVLDWPNTTGPAETNRFDDPRWNQAVGFTYGPRSSSAADVDFRALFDASSLYLSWEVKVDPLLMNDGSDNIWLGISQAGVAPVVVNIILRTITAGSPTAVQQDGSFYDIGYYVWNGASWVQPLTGAPVWIRDHTRVWVGTRTGQTWAIQMEVPRGVASAGLNLGTELNIWYEVVVGQPMNNLAWYAWPRSSTITPGFIPPFPQWGEVFLGAPPAGVTCRGEVALYNYNIGAMSGPGHPASQIAFTDPMLGTNTVIDTFYARPTNLRKLGDPPIPASAVTARFYLADWGSVVDLAGIWRELTPPASPPANAADIPSPGTAVGGTMRNDIEFTWQLNDCEREDYLPTLYSMACAGRTKRQPHQCMLVELSSASDLSFANKSVYRNMDFEHSSQLRRRADISVVGLTPIPDGRSTRTLYLYVETHNLLARAGPPAVQAATLTVPIAPDRNALPGDTIFGPARVELAHHPSIIKVPAGKTLVLQDSAIVLSPGADTIVVPEALESRATAVRAALESGVLTSDQVDSLMPTYRVHLYHETGDTAIIAGVKHPIVEAQTSFGFWVDHKGALQGWRHRITGATLTQLAPNYYRLAVPNNGTAEVITMIEAVEVRSFALSLHAGLSLPHGSLHNSYDNGFGITADLERRLSPTWTVAGLFGFHRFGQKSSSAHLDIYHISGSLEANLTTGSTRFFLEAGGGGYLMSPGPTRLGAHAGAGLDFQVSPSLSLGLSYRAHNIFTTGSNTTFSAFQAGGRLWF